MLIGGMLALVVGFQLSLPGIIHIPLVIIAGLIGGAIWGAIPGYLRAKTGAHEVMESDAANLQVSRHPVTTDYAASMRFSRE